MSATETAGGGVAVKLIGTCEVARILGVHRNTIRHWAENGILRARVLPTGARRFDPDDVEGVRTQIHRLRPCVGVRGVASRADLDAIRPGMRGDDRQILVRVQRGGIHIGEGELRYQLERKDNHPLAQADELLDVLDVLEARGLIEAELCFRLTAQGRAVLAGADAGGGCGS
jgi:DNA-binding transcriptional MerR regulator